MQETHHVQIGPQAFDDLDRLEEFLSTQSDPLAGDLFNFVLGALSVLQSQPGIGRPIEGGLRELIIRRGRTGYLARYRVQIDHDQRCWVIVLRLRHQRESGYTEEEV